MIKKMNSATAPLIDEQKQAIVNSPEFMEQFSTEMEKVETNLTPVEDAKLTECFVSCLSNIPFNNLNVDADGYSKLYEYQYSKLPNGLKMKALHIILGSSPKNMGTDAFNIISVAAREFAHIMTQSDEIRDRIVSKIDTAKKLGI